jgi:hypothetical protein
LTQYITSIDPERIVVLHDRIDHPKLSAALPAVVNVYFAIPVGEAEPGNTVIVSWNCHCRFAFVPHPYVHAGTRDGASISAIHNLDLNRSGTKNRPG